MRLLCSMSITAAAAAAAPRHSLRLQRPPPSYALTMSAVISIRMTSSRRPQSLLRRERAGGRCCSPRCRLPRPRQPPPPHPRARPLTSSTRRCRSRCRRSTRIRRLSSALYARLQISRRVRCQLSRKLLHTALSLEQPERLQMQCSCQKPQQWRQCRSGSSRSGPAWKYAATTASSRLVQSQQLPVECLTAPLSLISNC